ncbi:hypothetical protein ABK040_007395 [Willaertia magna]
MFLKDLPFEIILIFCEYLPLYFASKYILQNYFSSSENLEEEQYIVTMIKQRMINEGYLKQLIIILTNLEKVFYLGNVENNEVMKLFIKKHCNPETIKFFLDKCNFNFKQLLELIEFIVENNYLVTMNKKNKLNFMEFNWNYKSNVNNICKRTINDLKLEQYTPYKIHGLIYIKNSKKTVDYLQYNKFNSSNDSQKLINENNIVTEENNETINVTEVTDENEIFLLLIKCKEYFRSEIIKQKYITFKENDFVKVSGENFGTFLGHFRDNDQLNYYLRFTKFAEIIFHPLNIENYKITIFISYYTILQYYLFQNKYYNIYYIWLFFTMSFGYLMTWKFSRSFYFNNLMGLEYLFYDICLWYFSTSFLNGIPIIIFVVKIIRGFLVDSQFGFIYSNLGLLEIINNLILINNIRFIYNDIFKNCFDLWTFIKEGKRQYGNIFVTKINK